MVHQVNDFSSRHEFSSDDFFLLQSKYPNIMFRNIPDAWIILVDDMLSKIDTTVIKSVSQTCGFLKVIGLSGIDVSTVEKFEKRLCNIDLDYFEALCRGNYKQQLLA